ncbi:hypothetical protein QVD17_22682 [Tagetes erecta]|uniref:Uncharacterized protein n=1 Tax=Tagetes erecta TaxID=13708 RepID=A0AAD8KI51_TARER|nr:hypothetical protein QVD17_22682 [Tagetes erecta]
MSSLSGVEIGFGILFGCILLVLSAELYYLLWWKKRVFKNGEDVENKHFSSSNVAPCWKTSKSPKPQEKDLQTHMKQQDSEMGLVLKGLGDESFDVELMRLHNLCGPPRFLFTINEETKEDLESEVSKRVSRSRSLSDILGTPFLSPLASPVSQQHNLEAYNHHGLNPLFKMKSSPPPSFKFLRDAEEKLLMQMEGEVFKKNMGPKKQEAKDGSFLKFLVSKGGSEIGHHIVSTNAKVLPLPTSPSTTMPSLDNKC